MAIYKKTKFGFSRTDRGGTYQINDGDPQNDDYEFDEDEFDAAEDRMVDDYIFDMGL